MVPNEILQHVRQLIVEHSDGDPDKWWYANRFVFARLMLDERKTKSGVKKRLFAAKAACPSMLRGAQNRPLGGA